MFALFNKLDVKQLYKPLLKQSHNTTIISQMNENKILVFLQGIAICVGYKDLSQY